MNNMFVGKNVISLVLDTSMIGYGYLYVAKFNSGLVKIGITRNPKKRIMTLENGSGFHVTEVALSKPHTNYRDNESITLSYFSSKNVVGEWFSAKFNEVVEFTDTLNFLVESEKDYNERIETAKNDLAVKIDNLISHVKSSIGGYTRKTITSTELSDEDGYNGYKGIYSFDSITMEFDIFVGLIQTCFNKCKHKEHYIYLHKIGEFVSDFIDNVDRCGYSKLSELKTINDLYSEYCNYSIDYCASREIELLGFQLCRVICMLSSIDNKLVVENESNYISF